MGTPLTMIRVRLLTDTRHGKQGEIVMLWGEYVEALVNDGKAEIYYDKSMTARTLATKIVRPPKGGLEGKDA